MLGLELLVRNLLEAQAVVPSIVDGLDQVLLQRFRGVFSPKVAHTFDRALRQVALRFDALELVKRHFVILASAKHLVKHHAFHDCNLLPFANVQLQRLV